MLKKHMEKNPGHVGLIQFMPDKGTMMVEEEHRK
jgi:hypothetical protein